MAALWLAAADKSAFTATADSIDRLLRMKPLIAGHPRQSSVNRFLVLNGIGVDFDVIEDDKKVVMRTLWDATNADG